MRNFRHSFGSFAVHSFHMMVTCYETSHHIICRQFEMKELGFIFVSFQSTYDRIVSLGESIVVLFMKAFVKKWTASKKSFIFFYHQHTFVVIQEFLSKTKDDDQTVMTKKINEGAMGQKIKKIVLLKMPPLDQPSTRSHHNLIHLSLRWYFQARYVYTFWYYLDI